MHKPSEELQLVAQQKWHKPPEELELEGAQAEMAQTAEELELVALQAGLA